MSKRNHQHLFLRTMGKLFERIAGAALSRGVSFQELSQTFRGATLRAAQNTLQKNKQKITTTALHALTGIHRKEISRWIAEEGDLNNGEAVEIGVSSKPSIGSSASSRVIAHWISHAEYCDVEDVPLSLKFESRDEVDFQNLIDEVGLEVKARGVLSAMLASGLVEMNGEEIELVSHAYLPIANTEHTYDFLRDNVGDHLSAALHNTAVEGSETRFFERALFHSGLSKKEIIKLEKQIERASMTILQRMLVKLNAAEERDLVESVDTTKHRLRYGIYAYHEEILSSENVNLENDD